MTDESSSVRYTRDTIVELPSEESERMYAVRRREWDRIQSRISKIKAPLIDYSSWASACLGVAVSAIFAALGVTNATSSPESWLLPTCWISAIAFFALFLALFGMHIVRRSDVGDAVKELGEDMEALKADYVSDEPTSVS
jgi:hypothetical protein